MKTPERPKITTHSSISQNSLFRATPFFQPRATHETENTHPSGVKRMLAFESEVSAPVQAKLTIGQPGGVYEQEADQVASQVVNQIQSPQAQAIQRQEEPKKEEPNREELQAKSIQRQGEPKEEPNKEELQTKLIQRQAVIGGEQASTDLFSKIDRARDNGQPLEPSLQRFMGQTMGADFSGVRVHTDAQSDQLNRSLKARAFTTGQDVFFRQGEYNPGSRSGQELIAHELTHVVQQNGRQV